MIDDPIVAEVRKVRDELAKKFDYDIDKIFADLREKQKKHADRLVELITPINRHRSNPSK